MTDAITRAMNLSSSDQEGSNRTALERTYLVRGRSDLTLDDYTDLGELVDPSEKYLDLGELVETE